MCVVGTSPFLRQRAQDKPSWDFIYYKTELQTGERTRRTPQLPDFTHTPAGHRFLN